MQDRIYTKIVTPSNPINRLAEIIFKKRFLVSISQKYLKTNEDIKTFGLLTCGVEEIDRAVENDLTQVMITINDMVEYYKVGVTIFILNKSDSKDIYDTIVDYLDLWKDKLTNALNVSPPPMEDLILLDKFAATLFTHAKAYFDSSPMKIDIVNEAFAGPGRITPQLLLGAARQDSEVTKYQTMSNILAQGALEFRRRSGNRFSPEEPVNESIGKKVKTRWDDD